MLGKSLTYENLKGFEILHSENSKGVVSEPKIPTEQGMKLTGEGESGNL